MTKEEVVEAHNALREEYENQSRFSFTRPSVYLLYTRLTKQELCPQSYEDFDANKLRNIRYVYEVFGYGEPKWVEFSRKVIEHGLKVKIKATQRTSSKYVQVTDGKKHFKVRFSDHKAAASTENSKDSDFYVGKGNDRTTNTSQALQATISFFSTSS